MTTFQCPQWGEDIVPSSSQVGQDEVCPKCGATATRSQISYQ